jgi:hypothetical protein
VIIIDTEEVHREFKSTMRFVIREVSYQNVTDPVPVLVAAVPALDHYEFDDLFGGIGKKSNYIAIPSAAYIYI